MPNSCRDDAGGCAVLCHTVRYFLKRARGWYPHPVRTTYGIGGSDTSCIPPFTAGSWNSSARYYRQRHICRSHSNAHFPEIRKHSNSGHSHLFFGSNIQIGTASDWAEFGGLQWRRRQVVRGACPGSHPRLWDFSGFCLRVDVDDLNYLKSFGSTHG